MFAGGFGLDAAEVVVGDDVDVFAALAGLVDQSMVLALPEPDARYRLLEPVRQYAAARLAESGEARRRRGPAYRLGMRPRTRGS